MQRIRRLAPLLLLVAAACAEAGAERPRAERADSAGVEIVRNAGADHPLAWTFEPVLSLGGADEGPESFYQVGTGAVATDAAGNLFVLDRGNHRVVVFDSAGRHLRSMGRKGGGPGELEFPSVLSVTPEGEAGVFDFSRHGLVRFAADGTLLEPLALEREGGVGHVAATPAGLVFNTYRLDPQQGSNTQSLLLRRADGETVQLATLERPLPGPVQYPNCPVRISSMEPIFAPRLTWFAQGEQVALSAGPEYRIDLHRGERPVRSIRRDIAPAPATAELAAGTVRDGEMTIRFGSGECRIPAADVVEAQGFAPLVPTIDRVALAPDGTLWVRRGPSGQEEQPIDLFDATGEYLGTLPAGSPFPVAFTPAGDVVAVETDELDLSHVVVYRVRRG